MRKKWIRQAKRSLKIQGGTNFYDAIRHAIIALNRKNANSGRNKWIIALTDGGDTGSRKFTTIEKTGRELAKNRINVAILAVQMSPYQVERIERHLIVPVRRTGRAKGLLINVSEVGDIVAAFEKAGEFINEERELTLED